MGDSQPPVDSSTRMKSAVETLEGNKVKVTVEVPATEFEVALDAAFKRLAKEVRLPGFRPGKAPRRVLEARLGTGMGRNEALQDALPEYYAQAVRDNEVDAIAPPEIDITGGQESGDVVFDAVVEVRPQIEVNGYKNLKVEVPNPEVTEEDISERIDKLRSDFGELAEVKRPAKNGDHLTINMSATRDGEAVSSLAIDDYSYELGTEDVLPELAEKLPGVKAGEILEFPAEHPDGTVQLKVLVKEVREKVLPEITDEWASEASEFDTVEELRADIVRQMSTVKRLQSQMALRNGIVEALVALVEEEPPKPMVDSEVERRAHELSHRLESQQVDINTYLQITGQSQEDLLSELRTSAEPAVKADLALRAVADSEGIVASDDEVDREISRMAEQYDVTPKMLRDQLESTDQLPAVRSDLRKGKAVEWLIEHAEVVDDKEGKVVDRALLEDPTKEDEEDGNAGSSSKDQPKAPAVAQTGGSSTKTSKSSTAKTSDSKTSESGEE